MNYRASERPRQHSDFVSVTASCCGHLNEWGGAVMTNPILEAGRLGQSFWYDTLSRALLTSGKLRAMVEEDGLAGVTSNPTIFEKAMGGSDDYDGSLRALV